MPPKSRSLFIEYQLRFRPRVQGLKTRIKEEWNAKTLAQREQWRVAFGSLTMAQPYADQRQPAADAARDAADNAANVATPDFAALRDLLLVAINAWTTLQQAQLRVQRAWRALNREERAHQQAHATSLAHSANEANLAGNAANASGNEITRFLAMRDNPPLPLNVNGQRKMPEEWLPANTQLNPILRGRGYGTVGLLNLRLGTWVAQWPTGGGMSVGCLWICYDQYNVLFDRVFRKDVYLDQSSWTDPRRWEGDVRRPDQKTPWELACHDALLHVPNLDTVVPMREQMHRGLIDNTTKTYRLYLTWATHRDLADLITRHRAGNNSIPEPMVWYVAESLAKCGLAMERGTFEDDDLEWDQIVHRDLKPCNVFLGERSFSGRWPDYPKPLLGDFGLAFRTPPDDPNNPEWYNERWGTPGFLPPEQRRYVDLNSTNLNPVEDSMLSSRTNVYGVGLILYCLVFWTQTPPQPLWLGDGATDQTLQIPHPANAQPLDRYSDELKQLIRECLRWNPAARITFREMYERIQTELDDGDGGPDRAMGMRNGTAPIDVRVHQGLLLVPADPYRLGLARHLVLNDP